MKRIGGTPQLNAIMIFLCLLILPPAAPFASASQPVATLFDSIQPSQPQKLNPRSRTELRATRNDASIDPTVVQKKRRVDRLRRLFSRRDSSPPRPTGESEASLVGKLFFRYTNPLLETARERNLDVEDSLAIPAHEKMESGVASLSQTYEKLKSENGPETSVNDQARVLTEALWKEHKGVIMYTGALRLVNTVIQALPSLLVARLLRLLEAGDTFPLQQSLTTAISLVSVLTLKMLVENQYFHRVVKYSTQVRGTLSGLLFDKSLKLPTGLDLTNATADSKDTTELGSVLNLMQTDTAKVQAVAMQLHTSWDGILQIAMYTTLLYRFLGSSIFWGVAVLLTLVPVNGIALNILARLTKLESQSKDLRTKKTEESIRNMKLLKLLGWGQQFSNTIQQHRNDELRRLTARGIVRALNSAISNAIPSIVLVVTLLAYMRSGKPIVASTIFTSLSIFNQLRFPLFFYPIFVESFVRGRESIQRIASYMATPELENYIKRLPPTSEKQQQPSTSVRMKNGNFYWPTRTGNQPALALVNASLHVKPGEFVAVIGRVGSGKSALVKSLLGELVPTGYGDKSPSDVSVEVHGHVAYCSQEAWLSKGTIRDAILFDRPYDEERFISAVYDAGLDQDLLPGGGLTHKTDVGEGGSSLSGGQRARVALARALYSDSETSVFLLDDCLSALDASVGSSVFNRLRKRFQGSNSAVVLVTNDPTIPRRCDKVVLMENVDGSTSCSHIVDEGNYDELVERGHTLQGLSEVKVTSVSSSGSVPNIAMKVRHVENSTQSLSTDFDVATEAIDRTQIEQDIVYQSKNLTHDINFSPPSEPIVSADAAMSTGAVPVATYLTYLASVRKPLLVIAMFASYLLANSAQLFQQFTVARWTEAGGTSISTALNMKFMRSLVNAAGVVSGLFWLRSVLTTVVGVHASRFLHDGMLNSTFAAPLSYFSATPSGQLLTRYGKELDTVDSGVPDSIGSVLFCFLQIFMSIGALSGVVTPGMLFPLALISVLYARTMRQFRPAARDLKRVDTKTRSPIFTHFGEALKGVETIRSVPGSTSIWSRQHQILSDSNLGAFATIKVLDRWLATRLESLGNSVVFTTALASVFLTRSGRLKAGSAGWGLTQALAITGLMTWAVRTLTDLETNMISVMRVHELIDSRAGTADSESPRIPKEASSPGTVLAPLLKAGGKTSLSPSHSTALLKSGWPWNGSISLKSVSMRYNSASPLVLRNVSIDVPAGSTLGVVGRTGSGKSSLLLTLFRLVEIENGGSIEIDGIDIRSLGLNELRQSLAIIPQDPVLFEGTVAYNLDATGAASSDDMWIALNAASPNLARQFRSGNGLSTWVSPENFSIGQRQLFCLARALLRKSKILVLDEATSSVDAETDMEVQATIRREFVKRGVTVVSISHRIDSVLSYDNIAVLRDGELIEYGPPSSLLSIPEGVFKRLADAGNKRADTEKWEDALVSV